MLRTATWGPRVSPVLAINAGAVALIAFAFWAYFHGQPSLFYAAGALLTLLVTYALDRSLGICLAFVYLLLLGDLRRIAGWIFGFPPTDPLIAVGFLFALIIALPMFLRLRLQGLTEKLTLAVMVVMLLQVFNPAQGGITVGLAGAILAFPPLLWFWIGRTVGSEGLMARLLYKIVVPLSVFAAVLGYYQVFVGTPIWQQVWLDRIGRIYVALHVGGSIRAFGFSPSASEYNNLLVIAAVICIAACLAGRTVFLLPLLVLAPAILIGSQRSAAIRVLLAAVFALTFKNRGRGPLTLRFVIIMVLALGVSSVALERLEGYTDKSDKASAVDQALTHEIGGLAHPLDTKHSTAVGHSFEAWWGFLGALSHPIGYGLGSTTLASNLGTGSAVGGSEFEISDSFLSLGLPGGLLYLVLAISILRDTLRYSREGSRLLGLTVASLIFGLFGSWLFIGEYGNGPIIWFLIGCFRRSQDLKQVQHEKRTLEAAPVPALQPAH